MIKLKTMNHHAAGAVYIEPHAVQAVMELESLVDPKGVFTPQPTCIVYVYGNAFQVRHSTDEVLALMQP